VVYRPTDDEVREYWQKVGFRSDGKCDCGKDALKDTYEWPMLYRVPAVCGDCLNSKVYFANGKPRIIK
jgi:hypothetical protein